MNIINKKYKPYIYEALYCFTIDVLIIAVMVIIVEYARSTNEELVSLYWLFGALFLLEYMFNLQIALLSLPERKMNLYGEFHCEIINISIEHSFSGRFGSAVDKLFPQKMGMQRYKIKVVDQTGKIYKLRMAMSDIKHYAIMDILIRNDYIGIYNIRYGKLTRIILSISSNNDTKSYWELKRLDQMM